MAAALHARLAQSCALCRASLPIAALVMSFVRRELTPRFRHRAGAAASRYTEGDPICRSRRPRCRRVSRAAHAHPRRDWQPSCMGGPVIVRRQPVP